MLKYLSCPDLHFNPAWLETSVKINAAILKAARENSVDFVALPGDVYDAAILATDKGGINELIAFVRELSSICPIVAVQGTRSHDAPGSYGPLAEWVTLLEPGKMYGLRSDDRVIEMKENNVAHADYYQCVFFGIPEITKDTYLADNPTTDAEAANGAILALIDSLIDNEIAPMRALMPNVPAIGLLHGNVSDASDHAFETDNILKRSDIVIKTDTLARAGLTRWELGHIHTPWESSKISAGYAGFAGIDRNPWGKCGFVPSMNLVTINYQEAQLEYRDHSKAEKTIASFASASRVPYGTPKRVKIYAPLDSYEPDTAYWLEASDDSQQLPASGIHPWSRRTESERTAVSRRVDSETLESAKTLTDLARMFDPSITPEVSACFDEIEKTVKHIDTPPKFISVDRVRVTGCLLFNGANIDLNADRIHGLTQLAGANGTGKSSVVGFTTPYPVFIGKNTDSGRQSAIKDFFDQKDSGIEKWITFNGEKHHHLITIKGAHTQNPKTECFFEINGDPVQNKTLTFDEMMAECEARYGSVDDYIRTAFYVQPLQGPFESGLMTATMTTIRDLVQGVAGIDRTKEKRYALDRIAELDTTISRKRIEIDTIRNTCKNADEVAGQISGAQWDLDIANDTLKDATHAAELAAVTLASERARADTVNAELARRATLEATARTLQANIDAKTHRVDEINRALADIPALRSALESDAVTKRAYEAAMVEYNEAGRVNAEIDLENSKRDGRIREITAEIERIKTAHRTAYDREVSAYQWACGDITSITERNAAMLREIDAEIDRVKTAHRAAYDAKLSAYTLECQKIQRIEDRNAATLREIAIIEVPCPQCGYIDADIKARISSLRDRIEDVPPAPVAPEVPQEVDLSGNATIAALRAKIIPVPNRPTEPIYTEAAVPLELTSELAALSFADCRAPVVVTLPTRGLDDETIAKYRATIDAATALETERGIITGETIPALEAQRDAAARDAAAINVAPVDISAAETSARTATANVDAARATISSLTANIATLERQLAEIDETKKTIDTMTKEVDNLVSSLASWKSVDSMLAPSKIPAMELDAVLDTIDREASHRITPYRSGRYMFQTLTKQGDVDKFDIAVIDKETGKQKSFLKHSVGEKSFLNAAYTWALVKVRKQRMKTEYSPVILDEADSFIDLPSLPEYYEMQTAYFDETGGKCIAITHSPEAGDYITNHLDIMEVRG